MAVGTQAHQVGQPRHMPGGHARYLNCSMMHFDYRVPERAKLVAGHKLATFTLKIAKQIDHSATFGRSKRRSALTLQVTDQPFIALCHCKVWINRAKRRRIDLTLWNDGISSGFQNLETGRAKTCGEMAGIRYHAQRPFQR